MVWGLFLPSAARSADPPAEVVVAVYEGVINPVAAEYVQDAILTAQERHAQALLIRLDTPGGLDTSMRLIIKDMTSATVPVIVYVSPSGGRAASAGVFITMAAHVAAMAPGTNIGAAHPVAMGGGEMDKTMREKVENDSAAYIKSIAEQRGRNAGWAENAVRKSVSVTEKEAVKLKVIDLVADDVPALLKMVNGRTVTLATGPVTLRTDSSVIHEYPMSLRLNLLKTLSDPNIAYILMTVGTIGLMAELYNPGAILPGIVGAISLILAFYSFQSLPVNYAGLLLIALGILFFVLEATVTSYGLLAIGGVISMLLGSLMLIKTDAEFYQLSWGVILPVIGLAAAFSLFIVGMGVTAMRRKPLTGTEEMVGLIGVVKTAVDPRGQLSIHGELWQAVSDQPLKPGDRAEVTRVEGLTLHVRPVLHEKGATL
jgi:membrane-bound serine protease (ClpP class)